MDDSDSVDKQAGFNNEKEVFGCFLNQNLFGIVVVQNLKIVFANQHFARLSGYSVDELLALPLDKVKDMVHPDDQKMVWQNWQRRLQGEQINPHYCYRGVRKDGQIIWLEMHAARVNYQGKPAIMGVVCDITKEKQMEMDLLESEALYKRVVEQSHDAIYIYQGDRFLFVNDQVAEMTGYSKQELYSINIWDLIHPQDRARIKDIGLRRAQGEDVPKRYVARVIHKSGEIRHCEFCVNKITYHGEYAAIGSVRDITHQVNAEEKLQESLEKLRMTVDNTLKAMAKIVESRDPYTAGHQQRVARLALAIAQGMKLDKDRVDCIYTAAVIHDIGKIYVPAEILSRPTILSDSEFALVKLHPQIGYEILKAIEFPWPVAEIVLQHHERLDGSGYPRGLKNGEICLEAKILALSDVVEAMSSHRPYRPAKSMEETLNEIEKNKDKLYDAELVELCLDIFQHQEFSFD